MSVSHFSTSNGRTLANLFVGWSKDHLAQFCILMNDPNYVVRDNYYCVSDYEAKEVSIQNIKYVKMHNIILIQS